MTLPTLSGQSDQQITYAQDMRTRLLETLDSMTNGIEHILITAENGRPIRPTGSPSAEEIAIIRAALLRATDAQTWIDRQGRIPTFGAREWRWMREGVDGIKHPFLTRDEIEQIIALRTRAKSA